MCAISMTSYIEGTVVYVAHVRNNSHFVLLTDVVDVDQTVDDGKGGACEIRTEVLERERAREGRAEGERERERARE